MLVRGAVVAARERRPLAGLALACRRAAARHAAVVGACLDLSLDEGDRRAHSLADGPGHLSLCRDREVAANVLEQRPVGPGEIVWIAGEPLHRLRAFAEQ